MKHDELPLSQQFALWCEWDNLCLHHFGKQRRPPWNYRYSDDSLFSGIIAGFAFWVWFCWISGSLARANLAPDIFNDVDAATGIMITVLCVLIFAAIPLSINRMQQIDRQNTKVSRKISEYNRDLEKLEARYRVDLSDGYYRKYGWLELYLPERFQPQPPKAMYFTGGAYGASAMMPNIKGRNQ